MLLEANDLKVMLASTRYDLALINAYDFCPYAIAHRYGIRKMVSFSATAATKLQTIPTGAPEMPLYDNCERIPGDDPVIGDVQ